MATGRPHRKCAHCREIQAAAQARYRQRRPSSADYQREYHHRRRREALDAYGGRCACCDEGHWQFLTFDHIEGGGAKHRLTIKTRGNGFVSWLHANGFPPEIRVLCYNCNSSLGYHGECPHSA